MRTNRMLLFLVAATACASAAPAPQATEALSAEQLAITEQSLTGFTAEARMELSNSGDTPMQVASASWELSLDGKALTSGTTEIDKTAEPGQTLSFRVPASAEIIHNAEELKSYTDRAGQPIDLVMKGKVKVSQAASQHEIAFSRAGSLRAPRLPVPKMNDTALGKTDEDVTISFYLGLQNQNGFEVKVKQISYRAEVDGVEVGSGVASTGDRLPASQTAEYPIQENVPKLDQTKTAIPFHFTGSVDLGLVEVPIDLSGTINYTNKPAKPAKGKKKTRG